jgi:hypothetical protein
VVSAAVRTSRLQRISGGEGFANYQEFAEAINVRREAAADVLDGAIPAAMVASGGLGGYGWPLRVERYFHTAIAATEPPSDHTLNPYGGVQVCPSSGVDRYLGSITYYSDVTFGLFGRAYCTGSGVISRWTVVDSSPDYISEVEFDLTSNRACAMSGEFRLHFTEDTDEENGITGITLSEGVERVTFGALDYDSVGGHFELVLSVGAESTTNVNALIELASGNHLVTSGSPLAPGNAAEVWCDLGLGSVSTTPAIAPGATCYTAAEGTLWAVTSFCPGLAGQMIIYPVWEDAYYYLVGNPSNDLNYSQRYGAMALLPPPKLVSFAHYGAAGGFRHDSLTSTDPAYGTDKPDYLGAATQSADLTTGQDFSHLLHNTAPTGEYPPLCTGATPDAETIFPWILPMVFELVAWKGPRADLGTEYEVEFGVWTGEDLDVFTVVDSVTIPEGETWAKKPVRIPMFSGTQFGAGMGAVDAHPWPNWPSRSKAVVIDSQGGHVWGAAMVCCGVQDVIGEAGGDAVYNVPTDDAGDGMRGFADWVEEDTQLLEDAAGA